MPRSTRPTPWCVGVSRLVKPSTTMESVITPIAAIYGAVPLELVVEYLKALEEIKLVERVSP